MVTKTLSDLVALARIAKHGGLTRDELERIVYALVNFADKLETVEDPQKLVEREFPEVVFADKVPQWSGIELENACAAYPRFVGETNEQWHSRLHAIQRCAAMFGGDDDYNDGLGNPVRQQWERLTTGEVEND